MQLHKKLSVYLDQIEQIVARLPTYVEKYTEEIITPERINLRLRLRFDNGNLLEVNEAVVIEHLKPLLIDVLDEAARQP